MLIGATARLCWMSLSLTAPENRGTSETSQTPQTRSPVRRFSCGVTRRRMIGAYGDAGCSPHYDSQTRQPQLGASQSARSGSRHRVRTTSQATAAHARNVYLVSGAARLV